MRRRVFALLMAFVLLFSAVPTQAFAKGGSGGTNTTTYGTNLGWEYADVTANYDNSGKFTGFSLDDVSGSSHLGQYVTVSYSSGLVNDADRDGKWDEGQTERQNGIIANDSTKSVTITCASGYYIEWVVLACADKSSPDNPFNCDTAGTDDGVGWQNTSASFTSITLSMADIYSHANHQSNDDAYYLMIEIKPVPTNVYVGYFSGTAGDHAIQAEPVVEDGNLSDGGIHVPNTDFETWSYTNSTTNVADHTVLGISAAAEAEANAQGYSFAGWKLEYYKTYSDGSSNNNFSNSTNIGRDNVASGTSVELTVNAKLTAIWQPLQTITVEKTWSDHNNQDGIRPENVTIHLLKNGAYSGKTITLTQGEDGKWTGSATVPTLNEDGQDIVWSVAEDLPAGYTANITGSESEGFKIENIHTPEKTSISVLKVWDDDNDRDRVRPTGGIWVQLYNGETAIGAPVELTEAGKWTTTWSNLDKYANGSEIAYTVKEGYLDGDGQFVAGLSSSLSGIYVNSGSKYDDQAGIHEIVNTHAIKRTSVTVKKAWNDAGNQDGLRPASVDVTLYADGEKLESYTNAAGETVSGTVTLNDGNSWTYTFTDLPLNAGGEPIVYTVMETGATSADTENPYTVKDGKILDKDGTEIYTSSLSSDGLTITNTHTPAKTDITVNKVWDDAENQDGIRPGSVTVTLYKGEETTGKTETLSAGNNWTATFADLDKYANGVEIQYSVKETAVDGYTADYGTDDAGNLVVTNSHTPETVDLSVTKVYNDANNQDGKRPYAVVIVLCDNGTPIMTDDGENYKYPVTLVGDQAVGTWKDMPKKKDGQRISYTVEEAGIYWTAEDMENGKLDTNVKESGYSVNAVFDYSKGQATVTNTYTPQTFTLKVEKTWNDDHNRAGLRPTEIEVSLWKKLGDGDWVDTGKTAIMKGIAWTAEFTNLPRYEGGVEVQYTVKETAACLEAMKELGYEFEGCTVSGYVATLTNSRKTEYVSVTANKTWNDNDNQDGIRPEEITVSLYANGNLCYEIERDSDGNPVYDENGKLVLATDDDGNEIPVSHTVTPDTDGNWSTTFENLYKHYNQTEIVYTVKEKAVDGYTAEYNKTTDKDGNVTVQVINTHVTEKTSITVKKVWSDNGNQDGIRPASVTVSLYANGGDTPVATADITVAGEWSYTFTGLEKYANGSEIVYSVEEAPVTGYEISVNGLTVTNTHKPATTEISVTKIWDDDNNKAGKRPDEITLYLWANSKELRSVTISAANASAGNANTWEYTFTELPKYEGGKEINYTVYEGKVDGYTESTNHVGNAVTITNTYTEEFTSFIVRKKWDDNNNQDNARQPIYVQLYADGVASGAPVQLTAGSNWKHEWTNLEVHAEGQVGVEIQYSVKEGYLDDDGNFVEGLPEELTKRYTMTGIVKNETTGVYEIVNKLTNPDTTNITVTKVWDDADNQDGIRPAEITVALYANGDPTGQTATLNSETVDKDGNWTYTFAGLTKHYNVGEDIVYSVKEVSYKMSGDEDSTTGVPEGYVSKVGKIDSENNITVTNTHEPETTSVTVTKSWNDNNNQDGIRPTKISFVLYKQIEGEDRAEVDTYEIGISETGGWQYTISGLAKYEGGKEITYTAEEEEVDGYTTTYSDDRLTITNSHTPETISIPVKKVWDDGNDQDGKRPESVIVYLFRNGQPDTTANGQSKWIKLNEDNNWSGSFDNLPKYVEGKEISYTVEEFGYEDSETGNLVFKVPDGYVVNEEKLADGTVQITNSYKPEETYLIVQKEWEDDNNRANKRPSAITVTLYANGKEYRDANGNAYTLTLNKDNEWYVTFTMPKYSDGGQLIEYTVVENNECIAADGETKTTLTDLGYTLPTVENGGYDTNPKRNRVTVINKREAEKIEVSVTKDWDDANNQDGIQPYAVEVELYENGKATGWTETLSTENNWSFTFDNLYQYYNGAEMPYSVKEVGYYQTEADVTAKNMTAGEPEGYIAEVSGNSDDGFVVTNTHTPETIDITVKKVWEDNRNQDGKRPTSITVTLYAGDEVEETATLSVSNDWEYTFENLDKFQNGTEIEYSVKEAAVAGYEAAYTTDDDGNLVITNTHEIEKTEMKVTKIWDDNDDQDGKRPDKITVHLLADDDHTGKKIELSEANNWTYTWEKLDKYADGKEISYTVWEEEVFFKDSTTNNSADPGASSAHAVVSYIPSYDESKPGQVTITNSYEPETTYVRIVKVWDDDNNRDDLRPESLEVTLYADGEPYYTEDSTGTKTYYTHKLTEAEGWMYTWSDLPVYKDHGKKITYTVVEGAIADYNLDADGNAQGKVSETSALIPNLQVITNVHELETTGVTVTKIWEDEDDNDGKRPDSILVQLYASGEKLGDPVELSENNRWTHTWTEVDDRPLYVNQDGEPIEYGVKEVVYNSNGELVEGAPGDYTVTNPDVFSDQPSFSVTITNTRATEKTNVSVTKVWDDDDDNDGYRPDSVKVSLYKNGGLVETIELSKANKWTYTWEDLYKYQGGELAEYEVKEEKVAKYETSYSSSYNAKTNTTAFTVTNTHENDIWEVDVTKVWYDNKDKSKLRPDSITVQLYKDGKAYGKTFKITEDDDWSYALELPVYEEGEKIEWTVKETKVPKWYSVSYKQSSLTIYNTIDSDGTPKTGDTSNVWMWAGVLGVSGVAVVILLLGKKKKKSEDDK